MSSDTTETSHEPAQPAPHPAARAARILVVDDSLTNRSMLARHVAELGHEVLTAQDGREALALIETTPLDLVLLDVVMPDLDGYAVLGALKGNSRLRDIPVIMISAGDELSSVVRCIELGAEDYLARPFDPVLLNARLGACLEKKRLRDQEVEYHSQVDLLTAAAAAVESGRFDPESLDAVARRADALGALARVFQRMAREVDAREQRLQREVQQLRIAVDARRQARQVAEITETEYFKQLSQRAQQLRSRSRRE